MTIVRSLLNDWGLVGGIVILSCFLERVNENRGRTDPY